MVYRFFLCCNVLLCTVVFSVTMYSQNSMGGGLRSGMMGFGASMALPSGITSSVIYNGGGGAGPNALGQLGFAYTGGANFAYVLNNSMEIQAGLGYGSASFSVSAGTAPESQSTVSFMAGVRHLFNAQAETTPYVGANLSFTALPTIKQSSTSEISGSLLTFVACIGAQGYIAKNVSCYAQMGLGYNSGSVKSKANNAEFTAGVSTLSLGGSCFGMCVYW